MPSIVDVVNFVEILISKYGMIIIPLGAFLENSVILGFIFPGVTLIFLSGYVARTQHESVVVIIILAALGSFLGDNFDYFLGRKAGNVLAHKPLFKRPIKLVEPFVKKHGVWAVFGGRFSAWSRAWVALVSGIVKFPYWKFAIVSFCSATVWTSIWIVGGYLVGGNKQLIEEWLGRGTFVFWLAFAIGLVIYFRTRLKLVLDLAVFEGKKHGNNVKNRIWRKS